MKIGDKLSDKEFTTVIGQEDPSNFNYTVATDFATDKYYSEVSDIFKFPETVEDLDGVVTFCNAYVTTLYN